MVRLVDQAIDRKKLKSVRLARGLYRMAKAYAISTSNDTAIAHIEQMQRTLRISSRRRKAAAGSEGGAGVTEGPEEAMFLAEPTLPGSPCSKAAAAGANPPPRIFAATAIL